jgi:hypothetical protein
VTHGGQVVGYGASWSHGHLTARGPSANITYTLGPPPTFASCVNAWNAAPPSVAGIKAATPVAVAALNGGISFTNVSQHVSIPGNACTVSIIHSPSRVLLVAGAWTQGGKTRWLAPTSTAGLVAGTVPNATLGSDGRLTPRAQPGVPTVPVSPPSATPKITRVIGATGWAGGLRLNQTLAQAVARFGAPDVERPAGFGCAVSWYRLGLSATFAFGKRANAASLCNPSEIATSFTGTATWATTSGLRVGMPASAIEQRYPGAAHVAGNSGSTIWHLAPRSGAASQRSLTATTSALGSIVSISIDGGESLTYGMNTVGGTIVWGAGP